MKKPSKSRKRIIKRVFLMIILILMLSGAGYYGYSVLKQEYTVTYDSYTATTGSISNALSFSGNLNLVNNAYYSPSSATTVRTIYVAVGDDVQEGDKLIRLANGETIEAEFDGRINALNVEAGDEVTSGMNMIQVADFSNMKVSLRVDEYDIADVSIGQNCTVTATATEKTFESQIATIDYVSSSGGSVAYYTAVTYVTVDEGVYPGMQVTVSIPQEEATDVVILKADALSFDDTNQAFVWMMNDVGVLEQVMVETGVSNGNYVEIITGLADGDEVYVEAEEETTSAVSGLLSGLFGGQQFNQGGGSGSRGGSGMSRDSGGEMPGMGGAGSGGERSMPSGGGMPGGGN